MKIILVVFSFYYLLLEPVFGYLFFRQFTKRLSADPGYRLHYYKRALLFSWLPAGIIGIIILFWRVPAADVGISWIKLNDSIFGKWGIYGILIAFGLLFILYIYQIIMAKASVTYRNKLASIKLPSEVGMMLPHTEKERKYWLFIATSAGLIEELVYRGFLIYLLLSLFPGLHIYLYILISSILFGMAHTYQGPAGVLKTGTAGLLFSLVYVCTGSLLPGMMLHFIMDYAAKDIGTDKSIQAAG